MTRRIPRRWPTQEGSRTATTRRWRLPGEKGREISIAIRTNALSTVQGASESIPEIKMHPSSPWIQAILLGFATVATVHAGGASVIDDSWHGKARAGIQAVLEKYGTLKDRLEETTETRTEIAPGAPGKIDATTWRRHTVRLGENVSYELVRVFDSKPNQPIIQLQCDNADYHFTLSKITEQDPAYLLVDWAPGKRKVPLAQQGLSMLGETYRHLDIVLKALEGDPKFPLKKVRFDANASMLRIEYESIYAASGGKLLHRYSVDPANEWRIVDYRLEPASGGVTAESYTYGENVGGLSFPTMSKCLSDWKEPNAPPNMQITTRLVSLKLTDKTPADFRMSAFGLPEPMGMPPVDHGTARWYIWFTLAGFVCLALGALLLRGKRRSANPQPIAD